MRVTPFLFNMYSISYVYVLQSVVCVLYYKALDLAQPHLVYRVVLIYIASTHLHLHLPRFSVALLVASGEMFFSVSLFLSLSS